MASMGRRTSSANNSTTSERIVLEELRMTEFDRPSKSITGSGRGTTPHHDPKKKSEGPNVARKKTVWPGYLPANSGSTVDDTHNGKDKGRHRSKAERPPAPPI